MNKRQIYDVRRVRDLQDAIQQRFGGMAAIDTREQDGHLRIIEKDPASQRIHGAAEFSVREQDGEKLTGLSISSEAPVMRYGEPEILLHRDGAADFSRLMSVGAILRNHDPDQIVGVPVQAWIDDRARGNVAMRWGTTETAKEAKKEALEDKSLRGVSVGYQVHEWVYLRDDTETYKGISGPAWVAVKWDALEASLTPTPADPSVGLERSVRFCGQAQNKKTEEKRAMKKLKLLRAWKASDGKTYDAGAVLEVDERTFADLTEGDKPLAEAGDGTEQRNIKPVEQPKHEPTQPAPVIDAEAVRAQARAVIAEEMRAEGKRVSDIRAMCQKFRMADEATDLITSGKSADEARAAVMDKLAERQTSGAPSQGVTITQDGRDSFRTAAIDGLMLRSGAVKIEKPAAGAEDLRGMTLMDLAKESLRMAGQKIPNDVRKLVDAALNMRGSYDITGSTSDFPYILAGGANKSLMAGYEVAPATFPFWARTGSLNDFKSTSRIRFSEVGKLKQVLEGGKYTETKRTEKRETIQLGTYARKWTMSRQAIINDDLSAFTDTLFSFGMQARMLPNDLAIAVLNDNDTLSDSAALFSAAHGNYSAETDYRLDTLAHATAALKYMIGLMAQQKSYQDPAEEDGARYLNLRPKVWLVAMTDEVIARQSVVSASDAGQNNAGVQNPFANLGLTVIGDQNIMTSSTDYKHFLFADPRLAPVVEVAFLQGNQAPYFEEMDQTDADGRVWLVRLDCGAAAVDHVGAVLEVGTDA